MQFQTAFKVITARDNMIVEMVFVNMSGDNCLVIFEFFKAFDEFHSNFICLLRRYVFADLEGLNKMIEANAVRLVAVYLLRGKEGLVRQLRDAVVARDIGELFVLVDSF